MRFRLPCIVMPYPRSSASERHRGRPVDGGVRMAIERLEDRFLYSSSAAHSFSVVIPDPNPPEATLTAGDIDPDGGRSYHEFTVKYADPGLSGAVAWNTVVDGPSPVFPPHVTNDIRVTEPGGSNLTVKIVSINPIAPNPATLTATYRVDAPDGSWDNADSGTYTVSVEPNAVTDVTGNAVQAGILGTFRVLDTQPPTASLALVDEVTAPGGNTLRLLVTYTDNGAVNVSTVDRNDLRIIRVDPPGGADHFAAAANPDNASDGTPRTGIYQVKPPGDTWGPEDNGTYEVWMRPGQVTDVSGNAVAERKLGELLVNIAGPPTVSSLSPQDDETGVAVTTDLVITFNRAVQKGAGSIVLKRSSDNSEVQRIAVTSAEVDVSGMTATIHLSATLDEGTSYYVQVPAGAFEDLDGNRYPGINDPTAWNFTTTRHAGALGLADFIVLPSLNPSQGDLWYRFETPHDATLTLETFAADTQITFFGSELQDLKVSGAFGPGQRLDWPAAAGQTFYVRLRGSAASVDLRIANLVRHEGTVVTVHGTSEGDQFTFDASASRRITINGVAYEFSVGEATTVSFDGLGGEDEVQIVGSGGVDVAVLRPRQAALNGQGYHFTATNIESTVFDGGEGEDVARLYGSRRANMLAAGGEGSAADPTHAALAGNGVSVAAAAEELYADGRGGKDTAVLYGSTESDEFQPFWKWSRMLGADYHRILRGFESNSASAGGSYVPAEAHTLNAGEPVPAPDPEAGKASLIDAAAEHASHGPADEIFLNDLAQILLLSESRESPTPGTSLEKTEEINAVEQVFADWQ